MYEIKSRSVEILGRKITTYSREVESANTLEVEAGTNGHKGGDAGHGSRTYFRIQDEGCTAMEVHRLEDAFGCVGFEVALAGDSELSTIIEALKFIVHVLEDMRRSS